MRRIEIVEVSPRDGLQNEATLIATEDKVALIEKALAAGVRRIEAASFVNPKRVPQMADGEAVMAAVPRRDDVTYIGLALNRRGAERAIAAGVDEINYAVVASETFNRRNNGAPIAETLRQWDEVADLAAGKGVPISLTVSAAFGCPFEGPVDPAAVLDICGRAAARKPREIAIADTIGVAVPSQIGDMIADMRARLPGLPIRCHFHNTRGTGLANALAALQAGVDTLDASIGGIGGCPFAPAATGNICTEDLVYMLRGMGVETGLDIAGLAEAARFIEGRLGHGVPGMVMKAGDFPGDLGAEPTRCGTGTGG